MAINLQIRAIASSASPFQASLSSMGHLFKAHLLTGHDGAKLPLSEILMTILSIFYQITQQVSANGKMNSKMFEYNSSGPKSSCDFKVISLIIQNSYYLFFQIIFIFEMKKDGLEGLLTVPQSSQLIFRMPQQQVANTNLQSMLIMITALKMILKVQTLNMKTIAYRAFRLHKKVIKDVSSKEIMIISSLKFIDFRSRANWLVGFEPERSTFCIIVTKNMSIFKWRKCFAQASYFFCQLMHLFVQINSCLYLLSKNMSDTITLSFQDQKICYFLCFKCQWQLLVGKAMDGMLTHILISKYTCSKLSHKCRHIDEKIVNIKKIVLHYLYL